MTVSNVHEFNDYIVFVDESGDHGLVSIDPEFPVFALVFVLIKKSVYLERIVPAFQMLKLKYWGHDQIILHENEIRKEKGKFSAFRINSKIRNDFMEDLTTLIAQAEFRYIASIIHKQRLTEKYSNPFNPYEISLLFCLEKSLEFLINQNQIGKAAHIVIEGRGLKEDRELELEFRRICANQNRWGYKNIDFTKLPFEMVCADKKSNSSGLQLADLIARPIALKYLRPTQQNRTYEILQDKKIEIKQFP